MQFSMRLCITQSFLKLQLLFQVMTETNLTSTLVWSRMQCLGWEQISCSTALMAVTLPLSIMPFLPLQLNYFVITAQAQSSNINFSANQMCIQPTWLDVSSKQVRFCALKSGGQDIWWIYPLEDRFVPCTETHFLFLIKILLKADKITLDDLIRKQPYPAIICTEASGHHLVAGKAREPAP